MENHAEIRSVEGNLVQKVTRAGERNQRIQQPHGIATQRDSQPKYRHSLIYRPERLGIPFRSARVIIVCPVDEAEGSRGDHRSL